MPRIAKRYMNKEATVIIVDINLEAAEKTAKKLGNNAIPIYLDIADQINIDRCIQKVIENSGKIDILINNAAIFSAAPTTNIQREDFQSVFDINVS